MRDLDSLLVVSLEHAVAAPYASCKLADAGARVIKIERPEGDFARQYDHLVNGSSAYFVWINRGKESVCLNLKIDEDLSILKNMLKEADVFIQNLGPGVIDRLGINISSLRSENPKLIVCSISGYGTEGPAKNQKAYDLLIQAESGLSAVNGTQHGPARVGVSVCDIAAGMTAYQAILQAIIGRGTTGEGRVIEVSLFHSMSDWMNVPYLQFKYGEKRPSRMGLSHPTIAPYGAFECSDGKVVLLSIQNEREWASLCDVLLNDPSLPKQAGFENNTARVKNRAKVDQLVGDAVRSKTRKENIDTLKKAGIAYGRLSELEDVVSHSQNRYIKVQTEYGEVQMLAPGALVLGESTEYGDVPKLGEHSDKIRSEFE